MRTITKTVYQFIELNDEAKEKAREWYREGAQQDLNLDNVLEDAARVAEILGIDLATRNTQLLGGGTTTKHRIWWSGFSSQGDGTSFEGTYSYAKDSVKKIVHYAPEDPELHIIAAELYQVQKRNRFLLGAVIEHHGHYYHSGSMEISVQYDGDHLRSKENDDVEVVRQLLRDFADWIYKQLETEYEWQMSDEQVNESIIANEYEFDERGRRA